MFRPPANVIPAKQAVPNHPLSLWERVGVRVPRRQQLPRRGRVAAQPSPGLRPPSPRGRGFYTACFSGNDGVWGRAFHQFPARASSQARHSAEKFSAMRAIRVAVGHVAAQPCARDFSEDRPAHREPLHHLMPRRDLEARPQLLEGRVEAQHYDAPAVGIVALNGGAGPLPCGIGHHRLQLPPVREDADLVEPLDDRRRGGFVHRHRTSTG